MQQAGDLPTPVFTAAVVLLSTAVYVGAARWYHRRAAVDAEQPQEDDDHDTLNMAELPEAELPEAHLLVPSPNWMRATDDDLLAYAASNRGIDKDWRHMHEAAKAGRWQLVSRLCHELHISVLLTNKRGRTILDAAIDHKRYLFISWLANCCFAMIEQVKPPAYEHVRALFETPDAKSGRKPFLAAAARRDANCVRAMVARIDEHERLGPPSTARDDFLEAMDFFVDDAVTHAFLTSELRFFDVTSNLLLFEASLEKTDKIRSTFECAPWWPPNLEDEPWRPRETMYLYSSLLWCVSLRQVDMVAWFLDSLHVSPSPPEGKRWNGWHLGDHALLQDPFARQDELDQTEMQKDAAAEVSTHRLDDRKSFRASREAVMDQWDGLSSASLAAQVDTYLGTMQKLDGHLGYFCDRHDDLRKWASIVAGRLPQRNAVAAGTDGMDDIDGEADQDSAVEMLQLLNGRLGVRGAPRLQMIALTGSAWALRWLLQSGLATLETPLGGEERLPSLEEGGIDNCCICLEGKLSPVVLPCGHDVCRLCIHQWFEESRHTGARCPMCKQDVPAPEDVLPHNLMFALADDLVHHAEWLPVANSRSKWSVPLSHVLAALSAYRGAIAVLELLRDEGLDLKLTFQGTNLMHIACMNAQPHVVRWLAMMGHAQMALALSHEGKRPLHYVCESGDDSSLEYFFDLPSQMVQREARAVDSAQQCVDNMKDNIMIAEDVSAMGSETGKEHYLASKRAELETAERHLEAARAELAGAEALAASLAGASDGWVEAALASPFERVSNLARTYQVNTAANDALTVTLPRLLSEGAPLAAFVELQPNLKRSRIGDRVHMMSFLPQGSNPWLQVVRQVTEQGRADVLRWLYTQPWLAPDFEHLVEQVESYRPSPPGRRETYEDFGRQLATLCKDDESRHEFSQLYDDLRASRTALKAWHNASGGFKQVFGFTKESYHHKQEPQSPEPTLEEVMEAVARIDAAYVSFPDDMRPKYVQSGEVMLDPQVPVKHWHTGCALLNRLTCRNFVAVRGYLTLVRWFVEVKGSTVEQVMRMLYLAILHTPHQRRAERVDTQAYLMQWLLDHGADLASARFDERDYYDEARSQESLDAYAGMRPGMQKSLLDSALCNAVIIAPIYHDESPDSLEASLARCWDCVDLIQAYVPDCELTQGGFDGCVANMSFAPRGPGVTIEWWTEREGNVLRFLRLAETKQMDLSSNITLHHDEEISIAQSLLNGAWIGCVRWLAEERDIDVQHLAFDHRGTIGVSSEIREQVKEELGRLQRAQRQKHATRATLPPVSVARNA